MDLPTAQASNHLPVQYRRLASTPGSDCVIELSPAGSVTSPANGQTHQNVSFEGSQNVGSHAYNTPDSLSTANDTSAAWAICAEEVWKHEEITIQNWKEEIDTMLVFAGLFSAIVATFNSQYISQSSDTSQQPAGGGSQTAVETAINTLWFCALVFSLAAASIGITVKQWLEHYVAPQSLVPRQRAQIWRSRRRGLLDWHVPEIVTLIPLLLQLALALFLVGMEVLLWTISKVVACIVLAPVALLLGFTVYTTVAPTLDSDCPYRSPQAWRVYSALRRLTQLFTLITKYGWLTGWKVYMFAGRATKPWMNWIEREKAKLRHLDSGEDALDVLVVADKFIGGDTFLEQVVKPCLSHADISTALPIFHRILRERAHLVDSTPGQVSMPKWLADEMDNGSVVTMGQLAVEMLSRLQSENSVVDWEREQSHILELLERLISGMPATDPSIYEQLVEWFIGGPHSPEVSKVTLSLVRRHAQSSLIGHTDTCVRLGHKCLDMVGRLDQEGAEPSRQSSVLHALDRILDVTPPTLTSVYNHLCALLQIIGTHAGGGEEMVDLIYRYANHFRPSEETLRTLNSCTRLLEDDGNPVVAMSLFSAILILSTRLPGPDVGRIQTALTAATKFTAQPVANTVARKLNEVSGWWVVTRPIDACIAVVKCDSEVKLLSLDTLHALVLFSSSCDAMASAANQSAVLLIRERLRYLRDMVEGRTPDENPFFGAEVFMNRPSTARSRQAQYRTYCIHSTASISNNEVPQNTMLTGMTVPYDSL